jgi:hypothetical protein
MEFYKIFVVDKVTSDGFISDYSYFVLSIIMLPILHSKMAPLASALPTDPLLQYAIKKKESLILML